MRIFQPDRKAVPTDVTIWDWLFESRHYTAQQATKRGGFNNAATGVRIGYKDVKAYSTFASTALVQNHGLRPGDTIIILSPNLIQYAVAMMAIVRAGCHPRFIGVLKQVCLVY